MESRRLKPATDPALNFSGSAKRCFRSGWDGRTGPVVVGARGSWWALFLANKKVAAACAATRLPPSERIGEPLGPHRSPFSPTIRQRLVSYARVIAAIGHAFHGLTTAEEEVSLTGISNRPVAFGIGQFKN